MSNQALTLWCTFCLCIINCQLKCFFAVGLQHTIKAAVEDEGMAVLKKRKVASSGVQNGIAQFGKALPMLWLLVHHK